MKRISVLCLGFCMGFLLGMPWAQAQTPQWKVVDPRTQRATERYAQEISQREDLQYLRKLQDAGVQSIQGVPMAEVLKRAEQIKYEIRTDVQVEFRNADGSIRRSAQYQIDSQGQQSVQLALPEARSALGKASRIGLQTHETLGPIDRNFAPSSLIQEASKSDSLGRFSPQKLQRLFEQDNSTDSSKSGGTSGVGGGGDYRVQTHVNRIYFLMFRMLGRNQLTFDQILDISCYLVRHIEFEIDAALPLGSIRHSLQTGPNGRKIIHIYFPEISGFGSRDEDLLLIEFDIYHSIYRDMIEIFYQNSAGFCQ